MAASKTNGEIYEAVNKLRLELKQDIKSVDDKVNKVITAQAVDKTKLGMIVAGITVFVSAVVTVVVSRIMSNK